MKFKKAFLSFVLVLLLGSFPTSSCAKLQVGFYRGKCGFADVEAIVSGVIAARFFRDPTIVAALLRLQFHDCFTNGCDASILIDGSNTEKTAPPNLTVRGYEIIDEAKAAVEQACPGVVSCADLIAMAARDAVFLSGGGRYDVETGRRDGLVSVAQNVSLPGPSISVPRAVAEFVRRGLNVSDMVILLGAHSVGVAHCSHIRDRLFDFEGTGLPDPVIDPLTLNLLRSSCSLNPFIDNIINLDMNPFSAFMVDISYYQNILMHRGVLQIDQALGMDKVTRPIVAHLASAFDFPSLFGNAMVKLGAMGVLTGSQGEIRRTCRAINPPPII